MPRREFEGIVVSDKSDKTVIVQVESMEMNPIYKKFLKRTRKFAAHDELNKFKAGDVVRIQECPPISKRKKWLVIT
jgi:small subunit ribosomal protein S17